MQNNKNFWLYAGVGAVLVLIFIVWITSKPAPFAEEVPEEVAEITEETSTVKKPTNSNTVVAVVKSPSYAEALTMYADRRIQLNEKCVSFPFNPTYNNGTSIMLDNRAGVDRAITLGDERFTLGAYDFKIVMLLTDAVPTNLMLSCDAQANSADILLQ